jgi:norsolorinic acid ketoreductase
MSTIVFISGANRGLGRGLLQRFLALDDHTIIAGNRNPEHHSSRALVDLPKGKGSKLIIVKLDATLDQDAPNAVEELHRNHGIDHLDIVIANAGVSFAWPTVADANLDDVRAHMGPNVYGGISLYQATRQLMKNSPREPIFAAMGSAAGCIAYV